VSDGLSVCPYVTLGCLNAKLKFINAIAMFKQCHSWRLCYVMLCYVGMKKSMLRAVVLLQISRGGLFQDVIINFCAVCCDKLDILVVEIG